MISRCRRKCSENSALGVFGSVRTPLETATVSVVGIRIVRSGDRSLTNATCFESGDGRWSVHRVRTLGIWAHRRHRITAAVFRLSEVRRVLHDARKPWGRRRRRSVSCDVGDHGTVRRPRPVLQRALANGRSEVATRGSLAPLATSRMKMPTGRRADLRTRRICRQATSAARTSEGRLGCRPPWDK